MSRAVVVLTLLLSACAARSAPAPRRPALAAPEIVVSLRGLTVHVFDRVTGASFVYRAMPGMLDASGRSRTPVGRFATGPDPSDRWWYMPRRNDKREFGGLPFLRLTARNQRGEAVYGLHGPAGATEGYVSKGCVRLSERDILAVYALVHEHPSTPVTIQDDVELDADGLPVVVGRPAALRPSVAR